MADVFGYSERGMVNSLVYEMACSKDANRLVTEFISWFRFPFADLDNEKLGVSHSDTFTFVVEQSFSDFGDLDLLLLIDRDSGHKTAILIEAKVKTFSRNAWSIGEEWQQFVERLADSAQPTSSNLFIQLYRKLRLRQQLCDQNAVLNRDAVANRWSLGNNGVVLNAANRLSEYRDDFWYVMLVPDTSENLRSFFANTLEPFAAKANELPAWDTSRWGYLAWCELEGNIRQQEGNFSRTIRNFEYNEGQIYGTGRGRPLEGNRVYLYQDQQVWLRNKDIGTGTGCRVVLLDTLGEYFPQSKHVGQHELALADPQPETPLGLLPEANGVYQWCPPQGHNANPDPGKWQPNPPAWVRISGGRAVSTKTCRVVHVDENKRQIETDSFRVFTMHLLRAGA